MATSHTAAANTPPNGRPSSVQCPSCAHTINTGSSSVAHTLAQHQGSVQCLSNQKRAKQAAVLQQTKNGAKQFFSAFKKKPPVPAAAAAGPASTAPTPASDLLPPQIPSLAPPSIRAREPGGTDSDVVHLEQASAAPAATAHGPLGEPLQRLRALVQLLPDTVPLGTTDDTISILCPAHAALASADEGLGDGVQQEINQALDSVLQGDSRTLTVDELAALVRRGAHGMDGVCAFLERAAGLLGSEGALLLPRIERLTDAVATIVPTDAAAAAQRHSAQFSASSIPSIAPGSTAPPAVSLPGGAAPTPGALPAATVPPAYTACNGITMDGDEGKSPYLEYPFGLHGKQALPWDVHLVNHRLILQSTDCRKIVGPGGTACDRCTQLPSNPSLAGILRRMNTGVREGSHLPYYSVSGLVRKIEKKAADLKSSRLKVWGLNRKLQTKLRTLDEHKKFVMALASNRVPRLQALVRAAVRRKVGIRRIIALVDAAGKRLYKPRGYDEEDMLRGLLFLRLGGARVAELAHRTCGTPSVSALRHARITQPLRPSPAAPQLAEVTHNIDVSFPAQADGGQIARPAKQMLAVLMFDEIKVTDAARWDPSTNHILGFCREHSKRAMLDFQTINEAELLANGLQDGTIHLASEATIAAIGPLCSNPRVYSARPILISGTCKRESGVEHAKLIDTVLDACRLKEERTNCRIISVASDGESRRGLALELRFLKYRLSSLSPIFAQLADLPLFNLQVGENEITLDKDWKHVMKRMRNVTLRAAGFLVDGVLLNVDLIKRHLRAAGHSQAHIRSVTNPDDRQDVYLMFALLRDLWSLPEPLPTDLPAFARVRVALRTYGKLCYYVVMPYIQTHLSLGQQLEYLAAAAFMSLGLFTRDNARSRFIPPGLMLDLMHMVKNVFISVAKTKVSDPEGLFWIILLGTDRLETAFGILRTIVGNDANADVLQLGSRCSHVVECANTLARFPEWDRQPRRLRLSPVSESGEVSKTADHVNPASWKGDLSVRPVVLLTCWQLGRKRAEAENTSWDLKGQLSVIESTTGADMLAPFGSPLEHDNSEELDCDLAEPSETVRPSLQGDMDVEDVVGAQECLVTSVSPTIEVGEGKVPVYKARALRQIIRYRATDSTDRMSRVAKISRYHSSTESADASLNDATVLGEDALCVNDPIATHVLCEKQLFFCVGQVLRIQQDVRSVEAISAKLLPEPAVSVRFQILALRLVDSPDGTQDDWQWSGRYDSSHTTPGRFVEPMNPDIIVTAPGNSTYSFKSDDLRSLAMTMFDRLTATDMIRVPSTKRSDVFPYRAGDLACFVCEREGRDTTDTLGERFCPRCDPPLELEWNDAPRVLQHMAAHILFDRGIDRDTEPCGFCLSPSPKCVFFLRKGRGSEAGPQVDYNKSYGCERMSRFSYKPASTSTTHSPGSNVPLVCPLCPGDRPAVWRYNFPAHLRRSHPHASLDDYSDISQLSGSEIEGLRATWAARHSSRPPVARKTAHTPLKISEAHRAVLSLDNDAGARVAVSENESSEDDSGSEIGNAVEDVPSDSTTESDEESADEYTANVAPAPVKAVLKGSSQLGGSSGTSQATRSVVSTAEPPSQASLAASEAAIDEPRGRGCRNKNKRPLARDTCICNVPVTDEEVESGKNVIQCPVKGCETQWYHMDCHNFTTKPRGWKCQSCREAQRKPSKRTRHK